MNKKRGLQALAWAALGAALFFAGRFLRSEREQSSPSEQEAHKRQVHPHPSVSRGLLSKPEVERSAAELNEQSEEEASPPEAEEYFPRPEGEWQGYLVSKLDLKPCESTNVCRRGLACSEGKCGACSSDAQCLESEACVLDHCITRTQVDCLKRADCEENGYCVLVGTTSGQRGNESLRAVCMAETGENPYHQPPEEAPAEQASASSPRQPVQSNLVGSFANYFPERARLKNPPQSTNKEE
jgi:hypothetical protein